MKKCDASQPLRVALVPPLWARVAPATQGGVEYLVYLLAEELVKRGHEVTVFTSNDSPTAARIEALSEWNLIEAMEKGLVLEHKYYETCNIAEALQKSDAFDVIHFHAGCYAISFGGLSRAPVLHTLHNPLTRDAIWLLRRYPQAALTAVSWDQISHVPEERRRNIRIIHNACDFHAYQFSALPGSYLTFLGRMAPGKGVFEAIWVAREAGLPIVLAGRPLTDKDRTYFKEKIKPLVNDKDVVYVGQVDHQQKSALLRDSAALLFPIQADEAFGLVMIEAMASGTPVLAFRRSAVEEVIDFGKTGFYADSVQALLSFVPRALSLDRRAVFEHAKRRFSHERMVDEYLQAYEAILTGNWNGPAPSPETASPVSARSVSAQSLSG
jgi:glycosyltransferase involved in cell wall biosynthesis